ncbi:MAG: hypothetical protein AB1497_12215 [Bacillota bacterium]
MNKAEKKALVSGNVIVLGIDIAKKNHWARMFSPTGVDAVKPFSFQNSRDGFYRLVPKVLDVKRQ